MICGEVNSLVLKTHTKVFIQISCSPKTKGITNFLFHLPLNNIFREENPRFVSLNFLLGAGTKSFKTR